ncbi:MAG: ROK family protein [Clostridia bacterium]|nr:ROK family protein [Clostridia bacterium]
MQYLGISFQFKNQPLLDPDFIPFGVWAQAYLKGADEPFRIAVERDHGLISVYETRLRGRGFEAANYRYAERMVKLLLWSVGGHKVYLNGNQDVIAKIRAAYAPTGERAFDAGFMRDVYERPLKIVSCDDAAFPRANERTLHVGGHTNGCRIGFDAGGSDRKVSAVIDGKTVYSEEVVWHPKTSEDPQYQYDGIVAAFQAAAAKLPRVDGIGVSSAGVFIGNAPMVSSLFIKVPKERREEVKTIYDRAAMEIGNVPIVVANDGDVTALAGSMSLGRGCVMGLAMGTSEAVGYVDQAGNILGWFNELAFAPVDLYESAARDEWSTDAGVGCKYFSQDAVIRLAPAAGIALSDKLTLAEKLKEVQKLAESGHAPALDIFRTIGVYLAHTLCLYETLYDIRSLLVLGRVASGTGGDLIVSECRRVLREEYPALNEKLTVTLPDEKFRRVGQAMAAASLPEV